MVNPSDMKYLLPSLTVLLIAVGCITDLVIPPLEPGTIESDQGYVSVTVTEASPETQTGGCDADADYVIGVKGAVLTLEYTEEERPLPLEADLTGYTDNTGRFLFEGLPSGRYSLEVGSKLGTKRQDLRVDLGKVTRVYIKY